MVADILLWSPKPSLWSKFEDGLIISDALMRSFFIYRASSVTQIVKNPPANAGDPGSIPRSEGFPGKGDGNQSSVLAWRIPWTEELGGLQPMGSQRGGHSWTTNTYFLYLQLIRIDHRNQASTSTHFFLSVLKQVLNRQNAICLFYKFKEIEFLFVTGSMVTY